MIDANDKQTQSLALDEQPAKRRGRPATGAAMTNAERQRAYRERQKAQRNEKVEGLTIEHQAQYIARAYTAERKVEELEARIRELEAQLTQRNDKQAEPEYNGDKWAVYGKKTSRAKKWTRLTPEGREYPSEAVAMSEGLMETPSMGQNAVYTAIQVHWGFQR